MHTRITAAIVTAAAAVLLIVAGITSGLQQRLDAVERTQLGQGATLVDLDAQLREAQHQLCRLRETGGDPC